MTLFAIFAALLLALVAAFILPPLWLGSRSSDHVANRKATNLAIFRDQLAELEREKNEGMLADSEFEPAKRELQRRLLEEVEPEAATALATPAIAGSSRKMAIALLLLMPILALLGYGLLGNTKALDPAQTAAPQQMTAEQINGMVAKLAARMQANPDDLKGWLMLARSYKTMGRYAEAAEAYGKAEKLVNAEPDLLASYAETLAMANGKGLQGKPRELALRALKLDAKHPHALFLAGAAAMEAGDNKQGIAYWETLLPEVEPGSEIDQMLRSGIEKMKQGQ
ncbi:MAG: c-type cytochrome biogenesis protein CcmI [Betaproteobacteria bacterium HGW-Betaproteobacteria-10]|nr:MAG: c-type cytochrome biogenesis protein CcmI [Betaproteobacteria bacterium HGW-Betaproteobacteria-10]